MIETLAIICGLLRINESNFSEVQTKISHSSIFLTSLDASPIPNPIVKFNAFPRVVNSSNFSVARAFNGTMYIAFEPISSTNKRRMIPIYAINDLPLAVGIAISEFFPAIIGVIASTCGGCKFSIPHS